MNKGMWCAKIALVVCLLTGVPAAAQEAECRKGQGLRCWFIVGEVYKKPDRIAFIARHVDEREVDGIRRLEVLQVAESVAVNDRYAIWLMQVDCRRRMFRVTSAKLASREGSIREMPSYASGWTALAQAKYGESAVQYFACDPDVVEDRSEYLAAFAGNAYRAPDVVAHFRQVIWGEGEGR